MIKIIHVELYQGVYLAKYFNSTQVYNQTTNYRSKLNKIYSDDSFIRTRLFPVDISG